MDRRVAGALWGILALLAFGLAPPARPDWAAWCGRLVSGDWAGEDPAIVAHFQMMGVWPLAWAVLLRRDLRARPLPAWPFVLGSMALGALALLPWFVLRPAAQRPAEEGWIERALVHPLLLAAGGGAGL
ncbi:MAG TPA: hypothetical protein PKA64_20960, partial [Myxococcota bacterium]|nr:hypothetical protein [Myxococcota bacterium]